MVEGGWDGGRASAVRSGRMHDTPIIRYISVSAARPQAGRTKSHAATPIETAPCGRDSHRPWHSFGPGCRKTAKGRSRHAPGGLSEYPPTHGASPRTTTLVTDPTAPPARSSGETYQIKNVTYEPKENDSADFRTLIAPSDRSVCTGGIHRQLRLDQSVSIHRFVDPVGDFSVRHLATVSGIHRDFRLQQPVSVDQFVEPVDPVGHVATISLHRIIEYHRRTDGRFP